MNPSKPGYFRHRFSAGIIGHCVGLRFRFALSFRNVEEIYVHSWVLPLDRTAIRAQFEKSLWLQAC